MGAVAVAPGRLLAGEGATLVEFDTTGSTPLPHLSTLPLPGVVQDIVYTDGLAYVVTQPGGLQVVGLADNGLMWRGTASVEGYSRGVAVAGNLAYVAADIDGLFIFDVSLPSQPLELGHIRPNGRVLAVAVHPPYVYLADGNVTLSIVDATDPDQPSAVGTLNDGSSVVDLLVDGDRLYLATTQGLRVLSLADPAHPAEVGRYPDSAYYTLYSLALADGRLFVGHYQSGVEEFAVDAAGHPTPVCPDCPSPYPDQSRANLVALAADSAHVYTADGDAVRVMATDPSPPSPFSHSVARGNSNTPSPLSGGRGRGMRGISLLDTILGFTLPTDVALADGYAYIAAQSQGLAVVDLHASPKIVYRYTMGSETNPADARAVAVTHDDVILASGDSLHLFNGTDPAHPAFVGSVALGQMTALAVAGERVFAGGDNRVLALDLTTSDFVSTTDTLTDTRGLATAADYVYAVGDGGLRVFHWPEHAIPSQTGSIEGATFHAIAVGSVLAVGTNSGVSVLSLADPAHPTVIGTYSTSQRVVSVKIMGDTLYVLDAAGHVEWLSLADPTHPMLLAFDQALDQPSALGVGGGLLVSTDLTGGLFVWRPTRAALYLPFILR